MGGETDADRQFHVFIFHIRIITVILFLQQQLSNYYTVMELLFAEKARNAS